MKNKYRNELNIINYIASTEKYKVIFFISILLSIYGGFILEISVNNFFDSILIPLRFPIFNVFLFALIFISNINVCSILKKDFSFYISRLKNKKEYVKTILRLSNVMYLFHIFIILLFLLASLFLTTFNNLEVYSYSNYYNNYEISNLIYCYFYCIRYLIFGLLIINISSLIYLNINHLKFRRDLKRDDLIYEFVSTDIERDLIDNTNEQEIELENSYIIQDRDKLVGYIYIEGISQEEKIVELRYAVHPEYRRLGYLGYSDENRKGYDNKY